MIKEPTHFLDGTPIPPGYFERVTKLIDDVCKAEEIFTLDELEEESEKCTYYSE